jgi:hypothetical protein
MSNGTSITFKNVAREIFSLEIEYGPFPLSNERVGFWESFKHMQAQLYARRGCPGRSSKETPAAAQTVALRSTK